MTRKVKKTLLIVDNDLYPDLSLLVIVNIGVTYS